MLVDYWFSSFGLVVECCFSGLASVLRRRRRLGDYVDIADPIWISCSLHYPPLSFHQSPLFGVPFNQFRFIAMQNVISFKKGSTI